MFYSWTVSVYNLGQLTGAFLTFILTYTVPYKYSILLFTSLLVVSSLLYATATSGWMVLAARLLAGIHYGSTAVLVLSYLGKIATVLLSNGSRSNSKLKEKMMVFYSLSKSGGLIAGPGNNNYLCSHLHMTIMHYIVQC